MFLGFIDYKPEASLEAECLGLNPGSTTYLLGDMV